MAAGAGPRLSKAVITMQTEGNQYAVVSTGIKTAMKQAAKLNSSLAAKIKTKIQNTSSFFKISLKNNNKALALALVAQKEKSRLLETETVLLRKEVQALCFDLAQRRHKHNQLAIILKDLQASALNSLVAATDLFSNEDDPVDPPEDINEKSSPVTKDTSTELTREAIRVPLLSEEIGNTACHLLLKKPTRESSGLHSHQPGNHPEEIHSTVEASVGRTCHVGIETAESVPQEKIARPSTGLQLELNKWSQFFSDTSLEPNPNPVSLAANSQSIVEPRRVPVSPKREPPCPEKTTLCVTEMEITHSDSTVEIVTVETKPKRVRKEGVVKSKKKESVQTKDSRPPNKDKDKEEEKEKKRKKKSSSVHREETRNTDVPPAKGQSEPQRPAPFGPAEDEEDEEAGNLRKTYTVSLDDSHVSIGSAGPLEDDYFSHAETHSSGFKDTEILWGADAEEDEGPKRKGRKTLVVSASHSGSAITRKTYTISDNQPGCASTNGRRTKVHPVGVENESAIEGHRNGDPTHFAGRSAEDSNVSERQSRLSRDPRPALAGKRKGGPVSSEGPENLEGLILEENPPCEALDPLSEPEPKKSRTGSGARVRKQERTQTDDSCQVKKKKKRRKEEVSDSLRKEQDLGADLRTTWGQSGTHKPASVSPAGAELWAQQLEDCRMTESAHTRNNVRKTSIVWLDNNGGSSGSVDTAVSPQLHDFPTAEENYSTVMKTVTHKEGVAHVSADSNRTANKGKRGYSCTSGAHNPRVKSKGFGESNAQANEEEADAPVDQSCPPVNGKMHVISDGHAQGACAPTKSQRSRLPVRRAGRAEQAEEVDSGGLSTGPGDAEGLRDGLRRLITEERPPWEPLDASCTALPEWDIPAESPASSPLSKPASARVTVYEEQSHKATEVSSVSRALKSLTNTVATMDEEHGRPTRRAKDAVSYKELSINCKMRRGDKFTDTKFLNSPIFKDKKPKKKRVRRAEDSRDTLIQSGPSLESWRWRSSPIDASDSNRAVD
ncbi:hypothetical protein AAFF_G00018680 [Aldrovandia affinis]|uniref:Shugoshin C-terminal domain-containing protein n=1 Tax=Aldrovandia affinis TaxID=143900 RepID=A0AAD7S7L3_9TELE|nr:hypothetical protein AAFF_G00018680 [Aldrovandia affinis]